MLDRWPRGVLVAVAAVLVVLGLATGLAVDRRISSAQVRDASDELLLLMTLRRGALESYFDTVRAELTFWSRSDELRRDLARLREAWDAIADDPGGQLKSGYIAQNPYPADRRRQLDAVDDGSLYADAHRGLHLLAKAFVSERGYYDFFLIDPGGNVIYSVEKESDFGSNLERSSLRDSGLADVHLRALASLPAPTVVFSDFARYEPSGNAPALFGGISVLDRDGTVLGVLALQIPTERIQEIMQFTAGMGRTGETYLVGDDYRMRSDSRFSETSTTLETPVESDTVKRALAGATGVAFTDDYRGVAVLSAYGSFSVDGFDWAVMAEIDRDEVFDSIAELRSSVPLLGLALCALAIVSLWLFDPSGWILADIDGGELGADAGDLPPA
jgi:methyl-accepting chemotaxis protein